MDSAATRANSISQNLSRDFNQTWSDASEWLENLRRLVESDQAGFCAPKLANYLEAELQLSRRMPQLRTVCQQARRLCRSNPWASTHVADRVRQLQAAWLAVETRLAEFSSQQNLLTALSSDLKLLETRQCVAADDNLAVLGHQDCCSRRIERLDGVIQQKDSQMHQMLAVTAAIRKLLDWICNSEVLLTQRDRSVAKHVAAASVTTPDVDDNLHLPQYIASTPEREDLQLTPTTTGSTTYLRTVTNTDGDQADHASSDSSEIITQTGHNSARLEAVAAINFNGLRGFCMSIPSTSVTPGWNSEVSQCDNHKNVQELSDCDSTSTEFLLSMSLVSSASATNDSLSPLLRRVGERVAALKFAAEAVHQRLTDASDDVRDKARLCQLNLVEAALGDWQAELADLRASVIHAAAAADVAQGGEAIFRRAYLQSIALLINWTASLRDRCALRRLELRQAQRPQSDQD